MVTDDTIHHFPLVRVHSSRGGGSGSWARRGVHVRTRRVLLMRNIFKVKWVIRSADLSE